MSATDKHKLRKRFIAELKKADLKTALIILGAKTIK